MRPRVQASHLIKHLKELGTGLMNRADDCPPTLSQRLHKRNNLETGRTVQTAAKPHKEVHALIRKSVEIPQIRLEWRLTWWAHQRTWRGDCWPAPGRWPAVYTDPQTDSWCVSEHILGDPKRWGSHPPETWTSGDLMTNKLSGCHGTDRCLFCNKNLTYNIKFCCEKCEVNHV